MLSNHLNDADSHDCLGRAKSKATITTIAPAVWIHLKARKNPAYVKANSTRNLEIQAISRTNTK